MTEEFIRIIGEYRKSDRSTAANMYSSFFWTLHALRNPEYPVTFVENVEQKLPPFHYGSRKKILIPEDTLQKLADLTEEEFQELISEAKKFRTEFHPKLLSTKDTPLYGRVSGANIIWSALQEYKNIKNQK